MSAAAPALQFVLATYDINGTWLGLQNWTLQLQACGGNAREAALWTRWGGLTNTEAVGAQGVTQDGLP